MKPRTYHQGARDERRAILRKLRRELSAETARYMRIHPDCSPQVVCVLKTLIAWILQRNERYEKRPATITRDSTGNTANAKPPAKPAAS